VGVRGGGLVMQRQWQQQWQQQQQQKLLTRKRGERAFCTVDVCMIVFVTRKAGIRGEFPRGVGLGSARRCSCPAHETEVGGWKRWGGGLLTM
jgi:hypothetical protein